jgi:oligopeptidase B
LPGTSWSGLQRKDGLPRIVIRDRRTGEEHDRLRRGGLFARAAGFGEYDTDVIRFSYSSMTTPSQLFDYNMRTRERVLLKTQEVPSGHNPDDYVTRRVMAPAHDGELVPISLMLPRYADRRFGALPALRLRRLWDNHPGESFNTNCIVARRSRLRLCHRPYPRRQGQGLFAWYEDGKMKKKDEHLPRLHRRG